MYLHWLTFSFSTFINWLLSGWIMVFWSKSLFVLMLLSSMSIIFCRESEFLKLWLRGVFLLAVVNFLGYSPYLVTISSLGGLSTMSLFKTNKELPKTKHIPLIPLLLELKFVRFFFKKWSNSEVTETVVGSEVSGIVGTIFSMVVNHPLPGRHWKYWMAPKEPLHLLLSFFSCKYWYNLQIWWK